MRNIFKGYYLPSETQFDELWRVGTIALDANVLLNLYRYSADTRSRLVSILSEFKQRLWLPHQAAYEFHKNRLAVIFEQQEAYEKIEKLIKTHKSELEKQLDEFRRHPYIRAELLINRCDRGFDSALKIIDEQKAKHPSLPETDDILLTTTELFDGRVGTPCEQDELSKIYRDGELRYSKMQPPGYKDAKTKQDDNKFGDLVIWHQLMQHANETKLPIILVTDDVKEDWWSRMKGKTFGPRPELIEEMHKNSSVDFYMYKTDQFMEFSNKFIKKNVSSAALDEVRDIRRRAIINALLNKNEFLITGDYREKLVSSYNNLIEKKLFIESELNEISNTIKFAISENESQDMKQTIERKDELSHQLELISTELLSISKAINLKSESDQDIDSWEMFFDGDKSIASKKLAAMAIMAKMNKKIKK